LILEHDNGNPAEVRKTGHFGFGIYPLLTNNDMSEKCLNTANQMRFSTVNQSRQCNIALQLSA